MDRDSCARPGRGFPQQARPLGHPRVCRALPEAAPACKMGLRLVLARGGFVEPVALAKRLWGMWVMRVYRPYTTTEDRSRPESGWALPGVAEGPGGLPTCAECEVPASLPEEAAKFSLKWEQEKGTFWSSCLAPKNA